MNDKLQQSNGAAMGRRGVTDVLTEIVSTGAYIGYIPGPQGTYASFVTTVVAYLISPSWIWCLAVGCVLTIVGTLSTKFFLQYKGLTDDIHCDPGSVVVDEIAGMLLTLAPATLNFTPLAAVVAFALFRLFDIIKPGPVGWAEKLPGAVGIMADDIVAGLLGAATFLALIWLSVL